MKSNIKVGSKVIGIGAYSLTHRGVVIEIDDRDRASVLDDRGWSQMIPLVNLELDREAYLDLI